MLAEWGPIIVASVSIVGAVFVYSYQRKVDRQNALIEMRRTAYRDFLKAFFEMSDAPNRIEEIRRAYYQSEIDLMIVGSDSVIKAVGKLSNYYAKTNENRFNRDVSEIRILVAEICCEMRRDCFERTALTLDEIKAIVPIA